MLLGGASAALLAACGDKKASTGGSSKTNPDGTKFSLVTFTDTASSVEAGSPPRHVRPRRRPGRARGDRTEAVVVRRPARQQSDLARRVTSAPSGLSRGYYPVNVHAAQAGYYTARTKVDGRPVEASFQAIRSNSIPKPGQADGGRRHADRQQPQNVNPICTRSPACPLHDSIFVTRWRAASPSRSCRDTGHCKPPSADTRALDVLSTNTARSVADPHDPCRGLCGWPGRRRGHRQGDTRPCGTGILGCRSSQRCLSAPRSHSSIAWIRSSMWRSCGPHYSPWSADPSVSGIDEPAGMEERWTKSGAGGPRPTRPRVPLTRSRPCSVVPAFTSSPTLIPPAQAATSPTSSAPIWPKLQTPPSWHSEHDCADHGV